MNRGLFSRCLIGVLAVTSAVAHDEVTPKPKILQTGIPVRRLAGEEGETQTFKIIVPEGARKLVFKTGGGTGDVDIYAQANVHPTTHDADFSSQVSGSREKIEVPNPQPGPWYVVVDGFTAFNNVKLAATYGLKKGSLAVPRVIPPPGVYSSEVSVKIRMSKRNAKVRYTTDNSEPSESSPIYRGKLALSETTHLRARAFEKGGRSSGEIEGDYVIQPAGSVTQLTTGVTLYHRAGQRGQEHAFKIDVPADQETLRFFSNGGTGQTELLVKRGSLPTGTDYDFLDEGENNAAAISISKPEPGAWYVVLRGRRDFSGVSLLASFQPNMPDLIAWQPALEPYLSTETFTAANCEVQENLIEAGTHRLLRFSTETRNIGGVDLVMPDPEGNPDFEFAECHGHYHFKGFASYRLLDGEGKTVALGRKVSFCLLDVIRWDPHAKPNSNFTCSHQGIQSGWADVYDGGLPGQWIDVTNVAPGTYTLEVSMNPARILPEANYENNTETIEVVIPPVP